MNMTFKKISLILSVFLLTFTSQAATQKNAAQKTGAKSTIADAKQVVDEKTKNENLKFNQENAKLTQQHIEKMRNLSLKNTNLIYNRIAENQKMLEKLGRESILSGKDNSEFEARSKQAEKEIAKYSEELTSQIKTEEVKFAEMMKKRVTDMQARLNSKTNQQVKK